MGSSLSGAKISRPGTLDGPFVILLQQQGADQAGGGFLVGEDTDEEAVMPSTSRRPSLFTPTATITAPETMR